MKKYAGVIVLVIVLLAGGGVVLYLYLTKTRTPKVVNGVPTGITVDPQGNVYDAQNVKIGTDNGDGTYTTIAGAVMDYNGNVVTPAPTAAQTAAAAAAVNAGTGNAPVGITNISTSSGVAPQSMVEVGDSTAVMNSVG